MQNKRNRKNRKESLLLEILKRHCISRNSRIFSIIAISLPTIALLLNLWQSWNSTRPKINLVLPEIFKTEITSSGQMDFGIQFNFVNRGGSEAKNMKIKIISADESKIIGNLEWNMINDFFPEDTINTAFTIKISPNYFSLVEGHSIIFKNNFYFKIILSYKSYFWYNNPQTYYYLWNKETNRFENCALKDAERFNKL